MCGTCGCGANPHGGDHAHGGYHPHGDPDDAHSRPDHAHSRPEAPEATITLEQRVLAKNERLAQRNRKWLADQDIAAVNLMSSPGAGKTTLLERTVAELTGRRDIAVVEGDQETALDADRIRAAGCPVIQVNTGAGCHLDAEMMYGALAALSPAPGSLILVENVGNLVCPALFDLGERSRVVVISVTEGTDKPLKYPYMFAAADLIVINKADLLPYVDFDAALCEKYARSVNPDVTVLTLSATTGEGMPDWYGWLAGQR